MNAVDLFAKADRMAELGITRSEVRGVAGRRLGHVSMCLNGQRAMSGYLVDVVLELIKEREREAKAEGRTEV